MNTNYGRGNHTGMDFSDNDHTDSVFDAANLTNVDLSNCNLTRCTFKRATLDGTNFLDSWVEEGDEIADLIKTARKIVNVTLPDGSIKNPQEQPPEEPPKRGK